MMKALRYILLGEPSIPSREEGIRTLENLLGAPVKDYFVELEQSQLFAAHKAREEEMKAKKLGIIELDIEAKMLYASIRAKKPEKLIETGVGVGISTSIMLSALEKNEYGRLISIDDGRIKIGSLGLSMGCYVPQYLKSRWELRIGQGDRLIQDEDNIDFFFQDTEHSLYNVTSELLLAWPMMKQGGVVFVDDVNYSRAFAAFCSLNGCRSSNPGRFDRFGIIVK